MLTHTITSGLTQLSGNPIEIILTASDPLPNHKLALKVTCDKLMGSPYIEEIAPSSPGLQSVFDISGFIDQPVIYSFDYPAVGYANPHGILTFWVTIDIGEVYTDENGKRQVIWSNISTNHQLRILKGKLRANELAQMNEQGKTFASEYIEGGKFLTHLPNNQVIAPNQNIRLWYIARWDDTHEFTVNVLVTTNIKTHEVQQQLFTFWSGTGLVDFAIDPVFNGMALEQDEYITNYTFWLSDAEGEISERRSFIVDRSHQNNAFYFFYVNPLSGVDYIRLTGQFAASLKVETETAYKPVPVGSGTKSASIKTISTVDQRAWNINTGPKTSSEILALRDFLTAKECWMVNPDNPNYLIPVFLEGGEYILTDTMIDIPNLDLKIVEANR